MKIAAWVGGLLILAGVALGFVESGTCGSVWQPRDEFAADVNQMWDQLHGGTGADPCETATDYTTVVWVLIGAGVVSLAGAGLVKISRQETADSQEDSPSGNGPP